MTEEQLNKRKFELTQYAAFTQTVYAVNRQKARERMRKLTRFQDFGDFYLSQLEVNSEKCPRCGTEIEQYEHEDPYDECPKCGLNLQTEIEGEASE